jgi:cytochrome P450
MLAKAPTMARDPLRFLEETYAALGDVVELPLPRRPVLLLDDPAGVDHVLRTGHRGYSKRTVQYDTLALVTGGGLLTSDADAAPGDGWLAQRRLQQPAYHADRLAGLVSTTVEVTDELLATWPATGSIVDVEAAMSEVSLEVVSRALLGARPGETRALVGSVATALHRVVARARNPLSLALGVPSPGNLRLRGAVRRLDAAAERLVAGRRAAASGGDLVSLLLGAGLTDRQVRDEVVTTLVAGHETVASALTWTWWLLATHPHVQQRLADEVQAVLGPAGVPTDLARLPWTRQVVDESLRLYPPAWVVTRRARADDVVSGVDVRAGTLVIVSPWTLHRRDSVWAEPLAFHPERFAAGRTVPREAYLPFGAGPRLCIGREVALAEAVVVLARVAQRWSVEPADAGDVRPQALVTLRPRGGLRLRLSRR